VSCAAPSGWLTYDQLGRVPYTVSYTNRSLLINDQPALFVSGSIHYPRFSPGQWPIILEQTRQDSLNLIEVYVFWNYHERVEGEFDFMGRGDLRQFLTLAAKNGLFVNLRIGPYVCAEWNYGGIPVWVGQKPGIQFRTSNSVWQLLMERWMAVLVAQVRDFFADQGGPIILAQVENEIWGAPQSYIDWCGQLADSLAVNVPWIMCNGQSANNTINTCNANDCASFIESNGQSGRILIDQPALWTENEGWFQQWGDPYPNDWSDRHPEDLSYTVARWFARGGSHMNYYMYFGGNHFAQDAGSGIANWYANGVNWNSDTLPNEPKHTHMHNLHVLLSTYASTLVSWPAQLKNRLSAMWFNNQTQKFENGTQQYAFRYGSGDFSVTFLENEGSSWVLVLFEDEQFDLAPASIIVLDSSKQVVWSSFKVPAAPTERVYVSHPIATAWKSWTEPLTPNDVPYWAGDFPFEQLNVTKDLTEYLFYSTSFTAKTAGSNALVVLSTKSNGMVAFVDGAFQIAQDDHSHADGTNVLNMNLQLTPGPHSLTLLSSSLGIDNGMGVASGGKQKGIVGPVLVGDLNITNSAWIMRPFLVGELKEIFTPEGASNVNWTNAVPSIPITWFQTEFATPTAPADRYSVLLNATGMGRGHFYVNGHNLGRYWLIDGGTAPSQSLYNMPIDYLAPAGHKNLLTLFEELGGSPSALSVVTSYMRHE